MASLIITEGNSTLNLTEQTTILNVGEFAVFSGDINDLNQIETSSLTSGDILVYNATSENFENQQPEEINKGTLTKTFTASEEATITLSEATTTPMISATYEVPTIGLTNSDWDVETDGSNFDIEDSAYEVTLTPSATTGDITLTLSSGSWASSDVGKRIVGNGGTAILTATDGSATTTTDFADTSTIASGAWFMYGLSFGADGVEISNISSISIDVSAGSYDNKTLDTSAEISDLRGMHKSGTSLYLGNNDNGIVKQYTLTDSTDISTGSYTASFDASSQITAIQSVHLSPDKTKMYLGQISPTKAVFQYTLSTAGDVSTASYDNKSITPINSYGFKLSIDGTKMYYLHTTNDTLYQEDLSTAFDITTGSNTQSLAFASQDSQPLGFEFLENGSKLVMVGNSNDSFFQYSLSTADDISTASYDSKSLSFATETISVLSATSDNDKIYISYFSERILRQYSIGSVSTIAVANQYFPAITNASGQIDTTFWTDINSMTVNEALGGQSAFYAVSTDDKTTWKIIISGSGGRNIVRNNSGTWEYNSNTTYGSETWTSATTNTEFKALSEAMTITANKMTGTQLDAVSDSEHFTLEIELDLAIILYSTDSTIAPSSDGVAINYDGNIIDTGAVHGTDYTWDTPSTTSVRFTAINAGNFKVRVI